MELVRIEDGRAKIFLRYTGRSAEVIQEVGEGGVAGRVCVGEPPEENRGGTLGGELPQKLQAVSKGVASAQLRLRLLEQQVVCLPALQQTRLHSRCTDHTAEGG